ncbi:hypothetical protein [Methanoregula sp.]|uniref:hypothetical protein n=1 Tax=Methanoregula sp. TaxID=2052170 RepID=UPI0035660429
MILLMTFLVIFSVSFAGCTTQAPPASPLPGNNLSAIEPSQMVFASSDIPANFTLVEKAERNVSEMRAWAVDHGWKKGYYAVYLKNDPSQPGTVFEQIISVYPAENITLIIPDTMGAYKNWTIQETSANLSYEVLPVPGIGDSSSALKITDNGDNSLWYLITFVKKDVYQEIHTNGTAADYETLRKLADIAAAKIT